MIRYKRKDFDRIFALGFAAGAGVVSGARFANTLTQKKITTVENEFQTRGYLSRKHVVAKVLPQKRILTGDLLRYNAELELMATYCAGDIGHV